MQQQTVNVLNHIEYEENKGVYKSPHTKKSTRCVDIRRGRMACGICGSYNIVYQGVKYCNKCGREEEFLTYDLFRRERIKEKPICTCSYIKKDFNGHIFKISPRNEIRIGKCIDCGAVGSGRLCPNCGVKRQGGYGSVWKHWDGRVKCHRCGFTIDNPNSCGIGANKSGIKAQGKQGTRKAKEAAMSNRKCKRKFKSEIARNRIHEK